MSEKSLRLFSKIISEYPLVSEFPFDCPLRGAIIRQFRREEKVMVLKNGVSVINFSSPHPFVFDDGTILPGVSPEESRTLMLEAVEDSHHNGRWTDIRLSFRMTPEVLAVLHAWQEREDVDIILVPLPVMTALKEAGLPVGKCRTCRVADRVTKVIRSDAFCI